MSYATNYQKYASFETIMSGGAEPDVEHSSSHAILFASGSGSNTSLYFFKGAGGDPVDIAGGGTLTATGDSGGNVTIDLDTDSFDIEGGTGVDTTIAKSGEAVTLTIDVDLGEATEAVVDVSTDYAMFLDGGATGGTRKDSWADIATAQAGTVTTTGLAAASGVFKWDLQNWTASTTIADADLIGIDDGAGGTLRKMTRGNFLGSAVAAFTNGLTSATTVSSSGQISGQKILLDTNDGYIGSVGDTDLLKISASLLVVNGVASASLSLKGNDLVIGNFETIGTDQDTDLINLCSNNVHVSGVLSSSLGLNGNSLRIGSGQTIGCYGDTDLLTLAANTLTVAGTVNVNTAVSASTTISGRGLVIDTDGTIGTAGDANLLTLENNKLEVAGAVTGTLGLSGRSVIVDTGNTIGCAADTDLMTLAANTLTVAGTVNVNTAVSASTTISGRGLVIDTNGTIGTAGDSDLLTLENNLLEVAGEVSGTTGEYTQLKCNSTIGPHEDTDLMTLALNTLTIAGAVNTTTMSGSGQISGKKILLDTNAAHIGVVGDTDLLKLSSSLLYVNGGVSGSGDFQVGGAITGSQGFDIEGVSHLIGGAMTFGESTEGIDVTMYGTNANDLLLWDASENALIIKDGNAETVRMGGDATTDYAIDVGNGSAGSNNINKIRASAFVTFSDERLKSDVVPMGNALDTINKLKAVNFTWKSDGSRDFGFLAQDMQKIIPQAVHGTDESHLGVDYGRLTSILVSAIQEQSAQIKALQNKLDE
jgi:hypothetical protein